QPAVVADDDTAPSLAKDVVTQRSEQFDGTIAIECCLAVTRFELTRRLSPDHIDHRNTGEPSAVPQELGVEHRAVAQIECCERSIDASGKGFPRHCPRLRTGNRGRVNSSGRKSVAPRRSPPSRSP